MYTGLSYLYGISVELLRIGFMPAGQKHILLKSAGRNWQKYIMPGRNLEIIFVDV